MEVMIDIETLDTADTAVVFEVGAVFFKGAKQHRYQWDLVVEQQVRDGRTICGDTMAFHFKTNGGVGMLASISKPSHCVLSMHKELTELFKTHAPTDCWAKGNFDYPILESLFADLGVPWKFYQLRELRTLMKECDIPKGIVRHTALQDCVDQIKRLKACRKVIKDGSKRR